MKKNWARVLDIVPSIGIVTFGFWIMWLAFIEYSSTDYLFLDIILPTLIFLILALTGVLSTIYLTKFQIKEYFKKTYK
jgi:uncharacterized membrane protein YdfJ with MMPL/SSD domain